MQRPAEEAPASGPTIATELALERLGRGMSQTEIAKRAGLSGAMVSMIESGRRNPSPTTRAKLAAALECEPSVLFADIAPRARRPDGREARTLRRYTEEQVDEIAERYQRRDSAETIEADTGIPASTVLYLLERRGIARRPCAVRYKHPPPEERICALEGCEEPFVATGYQITQGWGRYCSTTCARAASRVAEPETRHCARKRCPNPVTPQGSDLLRPGRGRFCSMRCRGLNDWQVPERVATFVESLEARGLFKGRARQRWLGRWAARRVGRVGGKQRGYKVRQAYEVLDLRRREGLGIGKLAKRTGLTPKQVRLILVEAGELKG